jgi:DNA (cytosine-5)-methyltransferase 1
MRQASRGDKLTNNRAHGSGGAPGHGIGEAGDPAFTVSERGQAIAFTAKDSGADALDDLSPTLRAGGHDKSHANAGVMPAIAQPYTLAVRGRGDSHNLEYRQDGTANAVLTPNGGRAGIGVGAIADQWAVRRLTPLECERLMGLPDGWTNIVYRGKPAPDGPRYKSIGNSMAVPVVKWILGRIVSVDRMLAEIGRAAA